MTSPIDPFAAEPDPLEDLASRHVDGLTSVDEAAQVRDDPQLAALVTAMEAVRAALQVDGVAVVADRREQAVAAALVAFEAEAADAPTADPAVAVLVERRALQRRLQLVGAAAAVVLLAVAVPLLSRLGSGDSSSDRMASGVTEDQPEGPLAGVGGGSAQDSGAEAAPSVATRDDFADLGDLGSFDGLEDVVAAVRPLVEESSGPTSTTAAGDESGDGAAAPTCPAPGAGTVLLRAFAHLDGRRVLVTVDQGADGERRLRVVDAVSCAELDTRVL